MLSIIIVGINGWEEYTRPLINGIWAHHPDVELCVIDNASEKPYPDAPHIHRLPERVCYSAAINKGISLTTQPWILVLNNDVKCGGAFEEDITKLDPNAIYGMELYREETFIWLSSWIFAIDRETFRKVGEFDTQFEVCAYEDVDYCYRAHKLGIPTKLMRLPFQHYLGKTRWGIAGYENIRLNNRKKFEKKHNLVFKPRTYYE